MRKYAYLLAASALVATGTLATIAPAEARPRVDFSISLGNVEIAYYDGYYDRDRRWHKWRSVAERNWYRQNRRDAYFHMRRARDRDRYRRAWWQGQRDDWRVSGVGGYDRGGPDFAIVLGNVVFAYEDGYYDRERRWHTWESDRHRDWYRLNRRDAYFAMRRDLDRDRYRRDWWEGRRNDWRFSDGGEGGEGVDFSVQLGNVVFAYEDGYYDRDRRWHTWQSDAYRDWYRQNRRDAYFAMRRDSDRDRYRRDWWEGRRNDWRFSSGGEGGEGVDFSIQLGDVVFAYEDGYYDRSRRWHTWRNDDERDWYRRNNTRTYFEYRRDREEEQRRRDWWEGRRDNWDD